MKRLSRAYWTFPVALRAAVAAVVLVLFVVGLPLLIDLTWPDGPPLPRLPFLAAGVLVFGLPEWRHHARQQGTEDTI